VDGGQAPQPLRGVKLAQLVMQALQLDEVRGQRDQA
jgi:hypothetical protein